MVLTPIIGYHNGYEADSHQWVLADLESDLCTYRSFQR